jgi:hypothetical protein
MKEADMPADSPIVIFDGSFVIEADDEIIYDSAKEDKEKKKKRHKYKLNRKDDDDDKHIKRVVIERNGKVVYDEAFKERTCRIEIYWEDEDDNKKSKN